MELKRTFRFEPSDGGEARDVELAIRFPVEDDEGTWLSFVEVTGFDPPLRHNAPGVDAVQAVLNAVGIARGYLKGKARRGRLTLNGSEDLGILIPGSD